MQGPPPGQNARVRGAGSKCLGRGEKEAEWPQFHPPHTPGNSHCTPCGSPKSQRGVRAQWELRWALSRTDQYLGHYDVAAQAHVDRRFPGATLGGSGERGLVGPGAGPRACRVPFPRTFSGLHRVIPLGNPRCLPRLLERRVGARRPCGWTGVSPPPATCGPGDSRAEPLLRGSFRKKVDYSNLNRRSTECRSTGRIQTKTPGHDPGLYAPQAPGNSHCTPTSEDENFQPYTTLTMETL
jgi:hypothetical protein